MALDGERASARTGLGVALSEAGMLVEAIEQFQRVAQITPLDPVAQHNLGLALAKNGDTERALPHLRKAADGDHCPSLKLVAAFIAETENREAARRYLERAISLDPKDAEARLQLGSNYAMCKEWDRAVECYRDALAIDDQNARTYELLGAALADLGRWEEAETPMRRAFDLAPTDAQICRNLTAVLANLGRLDEAVALQRRAVELDPTILDKREDQDDPSVAGPPLRDDELRTETQQELA